MCLCLCASVHTCVCGSGMWPHRSRLLSLLSTSACVQAACGPDGAEAERHREQEGAWGRGEVRQRDPGETALPPGDTGPVMGWLVADVSWGGGGGCCVPSGWPRHCL